MADLDYFEQRGCYELALALLRDSLKRIMDDPQQRRVTTRYEILWLKGGIDDARVTCDCALELLGIGEEPWRGRFIDIALRDPERALGMISGHQIAKTMSAIGREHGTLKGATFQRRAAREETATEGAEESDGWGSTDDPGEAPRHESARMRAAS